MAQKARHRAFSPTPVAGAVHASLPRQASPAMSHELRAAVGAALADVELPVHLRRQHVIDEAAAKDLDALIGQAELDESFAAGGTSSP